MDIPEDIIAQNFKIDEERPATKIKYKALSALADDYPSGVVVDMLTHFDKKTVLKLLVLYGGKRLSLPSVQKIWVSYRNKIIVDNLDIRNDRVARVQLAQYFGVSEDTVRWVYNNAKQKKRYLSNTQVKNVIDTIYKKNVELFRKEMKGLFSDRYGIEYFSMHDDRQNPEDQYLLREAMDKMTEKCRADVEKHPIFIGRGYKVDYALKLIMEKIAENH